MNIYTKFPSSFLIILLIISFAMAGCSNNSQSAQTIIDQMANDMKSQLPKMLDKDTKLVNVYTTKMEIVSEYELLDFEFTEENKTAAEIKIEFYLKSQVCPGMKRELLSKGVFSKYVYKGKDGQYLFEKVLKQGDC